MEEFDFDTLDSQPIEIWMSDAERKKRGLFPNLSYHSRSVFVRLINTLASLVRTKPDKYLYEKIINEYLESQNIYATISIDYDKERDRVDALHSAELLVPLVEYLKTRIIEEITNQTRKLEK